MAAALQPAPVKPPKGLTAGEWRAAEWTCHAPTTVVTDGPDGRTLVIAECSGHGRHTDESLADAQLLAAAKELLVGGIQAAGAIAGAVAVFRKAGFPDTADTLEKLGEPLLAAIAKATGAAS